LHHAQKLIPSSFEGQSFLCSHQHFHHRIVQRAEAGLNQGIQHALVAYPRPTQRRGKWNGRRPTEPQHAHVYSYLSDVRVNILWFLSLIFSLASVLIGIIALQWLREHLGPRTELEPQIPFSLHHLNLLDGIYHKSSPSCPSFFSSLLCYSWLVSLIFPGTSTPLLLFQFLWLSDRVCPSCCGQQYCQLQNLFLSPFFFGLGRICHGHRVPINRISHGCERNW